MDRHQQFREDVDALRIRIEGALSKLDGRVLALAGLGSSAGTSTLALALASSAAAVGRSVLVLDASCVAPSLHEKAQLPLGPGVSELIQGKAALQDVRHRLSTRGIAVVTAGEALGTSQATGPGDWRRLFGQLAVEEDDWVVVDADSATRPSGLAVAAAADAAALVVEAGRKSREAVAAGVERLATHGANVLGVVLNKRRYPVPQFLYPSF